MFFCKNVMTTGIDHTPTSKKEKKRKRDQRVCIGERVDIGKGWSYCRPCYRARKDDDSLIENTIKRKKSCATSRLGYKGYGEQVCEKCWESYDHKNWQCSNL